MALKKTTTKRTRTRVVNDTEIIRHDRATLLARGLFVLKPDRSEKTITDEPGLKQTKTVRLHTKVSLQGLDVTYNHPPMGATELRVLSALVALVQGHRRGERKHFPVDDDSTEADAAWESLGGRELAPLFGKSVVTLRTSKRQITESIYQVRNGLPPKLGGKMVAEAMEALDNLAEVTIEVRSKEHRKSIKAPLVSALYQTDSDDGGVALTLNPRIVTAIFGGPGSFSLVPFGDMRRMQSKAAVLLLNRLCSFIDPGKSRVVGEGRLQEYIWGSEVEEDYKDRRKTINRVIVEMEGAGWSFEKIPKVGYPWNWQIRRPNLKQNPQAELEFGSLTDEDGAP